MPHFQERLLILQFSEPSRKIFRLLSNHTPVRILEALDKKTMSASELSETLDLRLNSLKYNLNLLLDAGLIKVNQIKWSTKGREIKMYERAERIIIFSPKMDPEAFFTFSEFWQNVLNISEKEENLGPT
jgi:ArsR family transcriptional regulator